MDNSAQKKVNYQQKRRIWEWITIFAVLLSLISGSVLLYQWWKIKQVNIQIQEKEQTPAQLEQKEQVRAQSKNTKISKNNYQKSLI
jgi:hypothetical protein